MAGVLCAAPAAALQADDVSALTLADQQLAGLLMVSACSLSYALAAVVLAAQMMEALARTGRVGLATPR
jgi:putative membrane protein